MGCCFFSAIWIKKHYLYKKINRYAANRFINTKTGVILVIMLKLLNFIQENSDWEERLSKAPYHVKVKRSEGFIMLSYEMKADFRIDIVRECRGIILDETDDYKPVCVPFFKFANYGEPYADNIDWTTARVQEKIDGSLIKVWNHKGVWRISTNKTINAESAKTNNNEDTFLNIFQRAWEHTGKDFSDLNPDYTYMFELVSPQSRVVVPYMETKLFHTGTRDKNTLQELNVDIGIEKPKEFSISTIEACVEAAKSLDKYHEGFVVVDSRWRRVKIKSPVYVAIHHILNNISSEKRIISIIISGEEAEVVSYFPEYANMFQIIHKRINRLISYNENELKAIRNAEFPTQKELAEYITQTICPSCLFYVMNGKAKSVKEFVYNMSAHKIVFYLDKLDPNRIRDFWREEDLSNQK